MVISYSLSRGCSLLPFPWSGVVVAPLRHPRAKWSLEPQRKQWSQKSWFALWHPMQTRLLWFWNGRLDGPLSLSGAFWEFTASLRIAIPNWTASRVAMSLSGLSGFGSFLAPDFFDCVWPPGWTTSLSTSKEFTLAFLAPSLPFRTDSSETTTLICSISSSSVTFVFWRNGLSLFWMESSCKPVSTVCRKRGWTREGSYFTTPPSAWDAKRTCCRKSSALTKKSWGLYLSNWYMVVSSWNNSVPDFCL